MNPYSQKKNCNRCKSFLLSSGEKATCRLGYKLQTMSYDAYGFSAFGEPLEPCPKPIAYSDYLYANKHYKKSHKQLHKLGA